MAVYQIVTIRNPIAAMANAKAAQTTLTASISVIAGEVGFGGGEWSATLRIF
jgi:uncharacterized protein involved in high-affinity Fe2+ transport